MGVCSDENKCITVAVTSTVLYLASITMVVIGTLNLETFSIMEGCKSAPGMPTFNIAGGTMIMVGLFIRQILKRCCDCCNDCFDSDKCCRIGGKLLKCGFTLIYDIVFMLVATVWLIAGTASVISAYENVLGEHLTKAFSSLKDTSDSIISSFNLKELTENIENVSQEQKELEGGLECDEVLYNMTLVVLVAGWIILAISILLVLFCKIFYNVVCCKPCKDDKQQQDIYYRS